PPPVSSKRPSRASRRDDQRSGARRRRRRDPGRPRGEAALRGRAGNGAHPAMAARLRVPGQERRGHVGRCGEKGAAVTSEDTPAAREPRESTPPPGHDAAMAIDTSVAHVARVYDYWLGGKDNFAADRLAGEQAIQAYPDIVFSVRANRAFL